jgi:hypothetical protein
MITLTNLATTSIALSDACNFGSYLVGLTTANVVKFYNTSTQVEAGTGITLAGAATGSRIAKIDTDKLVVASASSTYWVVSQSASAATAYTATDTLFPCSNNIVTTSSLAYTITASGIAKIDVSGATALGAPFLAPQIDDRVICLSYDSSDLLVGTKRGRIIAVDSSLNKNREFNLNNGAVLSLAYSSGLILAVYDSGKLVVMDAQKGNRIYEQPLTAQPTALAGSGTNTTFELCTSNGVNTLISTPGTSTIAAKVSLIDILKQGLPESSPYFTKSTNPIIKAGIFSSTLAWAVQSGILHWITIAGTRSTTTITRSFTGVDAGNVIILDTDSNEVMP